MIRVVLTGNDSSQAGARSMAAGTSSSQSSNGVSSTGPKLSLEATARREVLRRQLMSSFVRGEVIGGIDSTELVNAKSNDSAERFREKTIPSNVREKKDTKRSRKAKRMDEIAAAQALLEGELAL